MSDQHDLLAQTQPTNSDDQDVAISGLELEPDEDNDWYEKIEGGGEGDSERIMAIERLEEMVLNITRQLADASSFADIDPESPTKIEIRLKSRHSTAMEDPVRYMRWPLRRSKGASCSSLARLMHVLNAAHESLTRELPKTKRDIYYQDVNLFGSQRIVDELADDIAATLDLDRADLNIRASSKGLLCGEGLVIHHAEGGISTATSSDPIIIPPAEDIAHFETNGDIKWVLVVEKEAVFQTLCRLQITDHPHFPGKGIIITGKGYPDIATRQLVATLSQNLPESTPILAFVDGDSYGIDIASVYKFGSHSLRHEAYKLAATRTECIGLWSSELADYGLGLNSMLETSAADERKARSMLQRPPEILPIQWRYELENMLKVQRKAEIEILTAPRARPDLSSNDPPSTQELHPLIRYLSSKISIHVGLLSESLR